MEMIPVYRLRNGYSNLKKNEEIFDKCYKVLGKGKKMQMFSEGGLHTEYYLKRISRGSSRLVYNAQKKRIFNALKNSNSDSVIKFKEVLKKIIDGK